MRFQLEPVDHDKISDLCGPTNSILKQIEEELGIKILNRGPSFKINGESNNAQIAKGHRTRDEELVQVAQHARCHANLRP